MPYYFRCDYCNQEIEFEPSVASSNFHRSCLSCGQDICIDCEEDGKCSDCFKEEEKEERKSKG